MHCLMSTPFDGATVSIAAHSSCTRKISGYWLGQIAAASAAASYIFAPFQEKPKDLPCWSIRPKSDLDGVRLFK